MFTRTPSARALLLAVVAVVAPFVAATVYSQHVANGIEMASLSIGGKACPSIQHLSALRGELYRLQLEVDDYVDAAAEGAAVDPAAVARAREALGPGLEEYRNLLPLDGEALLAAHLGPALEAVQAAVDRTLALVEAHDFRAALAAKSGEMSAACERAATAINALVAFNANRANDLSVQIEEMRSRSSRLAFALDGVSAGLAIVAGTLAIRSVIRHAALLESHNRLLEQRASELEEFAARVAHDIVSPLTSVGIAFELATGESPAALREPVEAGGRSLRRVKQIVDGLYAFARSGARPEPGLRADVTDGLRDVTAGAAAAASEKGIHLRVDPFAHFEVGCSPGVLASLLSNLIDNAIKYVGTGPGRRIDVRVLERGARIRFEVEDNGPGLPPGFEETLFQPYARAPGATQSGIGLGLVTVKRFVQAHGGAIGVRSWPGRGCLFWFELPKAAPPTSDDRSRSSRTSETLARPA